jgi:hypothetical protein
MSAKTRKRNAIIGTTRRDAPGAQAIAEMRKAALSHPAQRDASQDAAHEAALETAHTAGFVGNALAGSTEATPCTIPPLHWWRERAIADIAPADLPMLRRCIRGFDMLGLPRWRQAERGDVAAAISVAFTLLKAGRLACPSMTLPGTALLIAAVKGDAAAASVIAHLRKVLAAGAEPGGTDTVRGNGSTASAPANTIVGGANE